MLAKRHVQGITLLQQTNAGLLWMIHYWTLVCVFVCNIYLITTKLYEYEEI